MSGLSSGAVMGVAAISFIAGLLVALLIREAATEEHEPVAFGARHVPPGTEQTKQYLVDPHSRKVPPRVWLNEGVTRVTLVVYVPTELAKGWDAKEKLAELCKVLGVSPDRLGANLRIEAMN